MATFQYVDQTAALAAYLVIAVIVAASAFVAAEWTRDAGTPAPNYCGRLALAAGILWPVMMIGLAELASLMMIRKFGVQTQLTPKPCGCRGMARTSSPAALHPTTCS